MDMGMIAFSPESDTFTMINLCLYITTTRVFLHYDNLRVLMFLDHCFLKANPCKYNNHLISINFL